MGYRGNREQPDHTSTVQRMSIFSFFRDPTRDWPESRRVPLVYDLAGRELNGIPQGAPAERLRAFGRPSNRKPIRNGNFAYPRLGIEIGLVKPGRVDMVMCVFQAKVGDTDVDEHPEFRPCEIELRHSAGVPNPHHLRYAP